MPVVKIVSRNWPACGLMGCLNGRTAELPNTSNFREGPSLSWNVLPNSRCVKARPIRFCDSLTWLLLTRRQLTSPGRRVIREVDCGVVTVTLDFDIATGKEMVELL